jgi:hypothetical protein
VKALEVEREKEREEDGKKESLKKALSLDTKKSLLRFARSSSRSLTRLIDAFLVRSQVGVVLFSTIASVKRSSGGALSLSLSLCFERESKSSFALARRKKVGRRHVDSTPFLHSLSRAF